MVTISFVLDDGAAPLPHEEESWVNLRYCNG